MKGIEMRYVEDLKVWVANYKKYKAVYDQTVQMFGTEDYYATSDILSAIKSHIEDILSDIDTRLGELYDDWTGKSAIKKEDFDTLDAYYEAVDDIDYEHEQIAGLCEYLCGIEDEVYEKLCAISVDFMTEFIL